MKLNKTEIKSLKRGSEKIVDKEQDFACLALGNSYELKNKFSSLFAPDENMTYWNNWFGTAHDEENRQARSLALLFFAEQGKYEDEEIV